MGRLFWKFFFAFWLALITAGLGSAAWWRHNSLAERQAVEDTLIDRHAGLLVGAAAGVLQYGGEAALRDFLTQPHPRPLPPLYAIDDAGQDLLRRELGPETLQHARELFARQAYPHALRSVYAAGGGRYLLFAALPEHGFAGHGFPPPPPPPGPHRPKPLPLWLSVSAGLLSSLLFSALLAWHFAQPLRALRNALAQLAGGQLDVRLGQTLGKRRDELADLGRDFDHMAEQIGSLVTAQQRLLHDVSHELRSPLARMQAAIGLAQQQPDKTASMLERLERESQRISDLVGELLLLSRLEAGVGEQQIAALDLAALLAGIVDDARFEAEAKGVAIRYRAIEAGLVECDGELLQRAVENVLRNAVQHCRANGEVRIDARFDSRRQRLQLSIEDQGPGVPEDELAAIFRPFFRGGQPGRRQGVGLGLTIAQRAVQTLGGKISAGNSAGSGLHVTIDLPFCAAPSNPNAPGPNRAGKPATPSGRAT